MILCHACKQVGSLSSLEQLPCSLPSFCLWKMCLNLREELKTILYCAQLQASLSSNGYTFFSLCIFIHNKILLIPHYIFLPFQSHKENYEQCLIWGHMFYCIHWGWLGLLFPLRLCNVGFPRLGWYIWIIWSHLKSFEVQEFYLKKGFSGLRPLPLSSLSLDLWLGRASWQKVLTSHLPRSRESL